MGNLENALSALVGTSQSGVLVNGDLKEIRSSDFDSQRYGKISVGRTLGGKLVKDVARQIEKANTTLVFTNVRSQTEYWFHALLSVRPEWEGELGIHHGSLDRKDRTLVEDRLRSGEIKAVVCTSSLDLGG